MNNDLCFEAGSSNLLTYRTAGGDSKIINEKHTSKDDSKKPNELCQLESEHNLRPKMSLFRVFPKFLSAIRENIGFLDSEDYGPMFSLSYERTQITLSVRTYK